MQPCLRERCWEESLQQRDKPTREFKSRYISRTSVRCILQFEIKRHWLQGLNTEVTGTLNIVTCALEMSHFRNSTGIEYVLIFVFFLSPPGKSWDIISVRPRPLSCTCLPIYCQGENFLMSISTWKGTGFSEYVDEISGFTKTTIFLNSWGTISFLRSTLLYRLEPRLWMSGLVTSRPPAPSWLRA
jgi:hypothetical protein